MIPEKIQYIPAAYKDLRTYPQNNDTASSSYTYLVYMNGSDLESYQDPNTGLYSGAATLDLLEMIEVGSNENLNIIIETGGTLEWANDVIDPSQNQRWLVTEGDIDHLVDLGMRNMGDPATLTDFIVWSVENFPADKYVLNFWNHGSGPIIGYGADEYFNYDSLSLPEIQTALYNAYKETGIIFEVIGFDTCLMATIETAHILQPYARYLVASEELEPGHGWDYTPIFAAITENPGIRGDQLGKVIADGFLEHSIENDTDDYITLSVIDLRKINPVIDSLEDFILAATPDISHSYGFNTLSKGRSKTESYGGWDGESGYSDIIDLSHFASNLSNEYYEAYTLVAAIDDAVVYKVNGAARQYGQGLSIYFPFKDKENFEHHLYAYYQIDFSPLYKDFIYDYMTALLTDVSDISIESVDTYDDRFSIQISEEDRDKIEFIFMTLGYYLDEAEEELLILGVDNNVFYDPETGIVSDNFSGWWVGLNDHFVSFTIIEETEKYNRYSIPVLLNGIEMTILASWFWDERYDGGGYYKVHGAWKGINPETLIADKSLIKIKEGDVIVPLLEYYNAVTDESDWLEGEAFVVEGTLELHDMQLPDGTYLYGFYVSDFAGNEIYSEFITIDLYE